MIALRTKATMLLLMRGDYCLQFHAKLFKENDPEIKFVFFFNLYIEKLTDSLNAIHNF